MPGLSYLTDQQLWQLVTYLQSLRYDAADLNSRSDSLANRRVLGPVDMRH